MARDYEKAQRWNSEERRLYGSVHATYQYYSRFDNNPRYESKPTTLCELTINDLYWFNVLPSCRVTCSKCLAKMRENTAWKDTDG